MIEHEEMIRQIIFDVLNVPKTSIKEIMPTPGGETNDSYYVRVNEQVYVVRLPGKGTEKLLSRRAEKANLEFATALGINPALIYYDAESGVKISEMIHGTKALTPQSVVNEQQMNQVIKILQKLHHAEEPMKNNFDLFQMMKGYEALIEQEIPFMYEKTTNLRSVVWELVDIYTNFDVIFTPCHIDVCCENLLINADEKIYLIDWEYSGMFDPLFDLATLALSFELKGQDELNFFTKYFVRIPTTEELQRIHLLKIFLDYNWALWYFYKETKGETFHHAGAKRFARAIENSNKYKQDYLDHLVI